jgi:hypothetical protein
MQALSLPAIDGSMVPTYGSLSVKESKVVKVPIMTGIVSNEGAVWIPDFIKDWDELRAFLQS